MQKIKCSYSTLEEIYNTFDTMEYKAGDYVPTEDDLKLMSENLSEYLPFLMWIEETGTDTEDNKEVRHIIRTIINSGMDLTEEKG